MFVSGEGGLRFKFRAGQIIRGVPNSSPLLRHFERSCIAWAYTLRRNTAIIMKDLIFYGIIEKLVKVFVRQLKKVSHSYSDLIVDYHHMLDPVLPTELAGFRMVIVFTTPRHIGYSAFFSAIYSGFFFTHNTAHFFLFEDSKQYVMSSVN